jgi:hypothetical protein
MKITLQGRDPSAATPIPGKPPGVVLPSSGTGQALQERPELAVLRQFIRLGQTEAALRAEMLPWAHSVAPALIKEFCGWRFQFPSTRRIFEEYSQTRDTSLAVLREHPEMTQVCQIEKPRHGRNSSQDEGARRQRRRGV